MVSRKLKLAFIWQTNSKDIFPFWQDGYRAALDIVGQKHDLDWYLGTFEELEKIDISSKYDVLMFWGGSDNKYHQTMIGRPERKLWLYPGGEIDLEIAKQYNVVFTEDRLYEEQIKKTGTRVIRATGTNMAIFKPENRKKYFGAFLPGTFSNWKRQDLFAQAVGSEGLCSGTVQPDGIEFLYKCRELGTHAIVGYLPAECLATLYNMSEVVILPVVHGSQRTLLEALGMNIPCVVGNHFRPTVELALEIGGTRIVDLKPEMIREAWLKMKGRKINTRPYVSHHYGERQFAEKLLLGIEDL